MIGFLSQSGLRSKGAESGRVHRTEACANLIHSLPRACIVERFVDPGRVRIIFLADDQVHRHVRDVCRVCWRIT